MLIGIWRKPNELCTPGLCTVDGEPFGVTLERPWFHNKRQVSCIPEGTYTLDIRQSPKFGRPMLILDKVPGRSGILIHGANHWTELQGCIAVAEHKVDEERIQGDLSKVLKDLVRAAMNRGEKVEIQTIGERV